MLATEVSNFEGLRIDDLWPAGLVTAVTPLGASMLSTALAHRRTSSDLSSAVAKLKSELKGAEGESRSESDAVVSEGTIPATIFTVEGVTRKVRDAVASGLLTLDRRLDRIERQARVLETHRLALMQTYHTQGLSQSRVSFWFSLVLATAGFVVITIAATGLFSSSTEGSAVGLVSGAITEALSALFFAQSNRARKLMQDFFADLRDDQRREDALSLVGRIEDGGLRAAAQAAIALQLIDSTVSPSVLPGFGSKESTPADTVVDEGLKHSISTCALRAPGLPLKARRERLRADLRALGNDAPRVNATPPDASLPLATSPTAPVRQAVPRLARKMGSALVSGGISPRSCTYREPRSAH